MLNINLAAATTPKTEYHHKFCTLKNSYKSIKNQCYKLGKLPLANLIPTLESKSADSIFTKIKILAEKQKSNHSFLSFMLKTFVV